MGSRLARGAALVRAEWALLAQAWGMLLVCDLGLRVLPFPRMERWARGPRSPASRPPADAAATARRLQRLVSVAARCHLWPMRCLRQALVLRRLLARHGIAAELRLGVRKEDGKLLAHAWLEYGSTPLGQPPALLERYRPLAPSGSER